MQVLTEVMFGEFSTWHCPLTNKSLRQQKPLNMLLKQKNPKMSPVLYQSLGWRVGALVNSLSFYIVHRWSVFENLNWEI
jgi:hypothetical protein